MTAATSRFRAAARNLVPSGLDRVLRGVIGDRANADNTSLYRRVAPYTLNSPEGLATLHRLATQTRKRGVMGDVVECGTYKGGSAAVLATTLSNGQHLWLYDSFEGMPATREVDGQRAAEWVGQCVALEEQVREALAVVGARPEQYTIRKGWFSETFTQPLPQRVAFLHCDADWYDSVLLVLETFYPRVEPGGCVVLDDYGHWEGCREAFYDFCSRHGEKPLIERSGHSQAFWFKGRVHNR